MTNSKELKKEIKKSGLKMNYIANQLKITRTALYNKINGKNDFKSNEMYKLMDLLDISNERSRLIFFDLNVAKMDT